MAGLLSQFGIKSATDLQKESEIARKQEAMSVAQLSPDQYMMYNAKQGGEQYVAPLKKLFGIQSPEQKEANAQEAFAQEQMQTLKTATSQKDLVNKLQEASFAALRNGYVELGQKFGALAKQTKVATPKPVTVAEGSSLVNPLTGQVVYNNPKAAKAVEQWSNPYEMAGVGMVRKNLVTNEVKKIGSAGVTVINQGDNKEAEEHAKFRIKQYETISDKADNAGQQNQDYDVLEGLLASGTSTGIKDAMLLKGSMFLESVGIQIGESTTDQQVFDALTKKLALSNRKDMPGPMSDSDRGFLVDMEASLKKDPTANRKLIGIRREINNRHIDRQRFMDDWYTENGNFKGAAQAWNKWNRANPVFTDEVKSRLFAAPAKKEVSANEFTLDDGTVWIPDVSSPSGYRQVR